MAEPPPGSPATADDARSAMLIRRLLEGASAAGEPAALAETHISWVLLTGPVAYKIKKPIRLPFLDFTTLESRRHFCEEELRLNRRLAPALYLGVVPIGGSVESPELEHEPAIEHAVKMRRFSPEARLDAALINGDVRREHLRELAALLARFHQKLPPVSDPRFGTAAAVEKTVYDNIAELGAALTGSEDTALIAQVADWTHAACTRLHETFAARHAAGAIRDGHGDLHLENLVLLDDRIVPFDALEFDAALRCGDTISEAAFLAMDLMAHERSDLAFVFLNHYLELGGDYAGVAVLRFYLVYRAAVRAKVCALKARQQGGSFATSGRKYLVLAAALTHETQPLWLITHGLSGSGKTHVTSELVERLPALRVRSDLERKRIHGRAASERSKSAVGGDLYAPAATERTYERIEVCARHCAGAGFNTIVDAAFLDRALRQRFAAAARECAARFVMLDCAAPVPLLRQRIAARDAARVDASEATLPVLEHQLVTAQALTRAELEHTLKLDTAQPIDYDRLAAELRSGHVPAQSS